MIDSCAFESHTFSPFSVEWKRKSQFKVATERKRRNVWFWIFAAKMFNFASQQWRRIDYFFAGIEFYDFDRFDEFLLPASTPNKIDAWTMSVFFWIFISFYSSALLWISFSSYLQPNRDSLTIELLNWRSFIMAKMTRYRKTWISSANRIPRRENNVPFLSLNNTDMTQRPTTD